MKSLKEFYKTKETNIISVIGSGSSINRLDKKQWDFITNNDSIGVNNIFYHPTFVPKYLTMEIKSYDFEPSKQHIERKWNNGWKNVHYILAADRAEYTSKVIGHKSTAKIYSYPYIKRGDHPRNNPDVKIDAKFDISGPITKSYDSSVTAIVHLLCQMGYEKIVLFGLDGYNSYYFWSHLDPLIYGPFHDLTNKAREGKDPNKPHNAFHIKDYIIDFNNRWMLPNGKKILVGHKDTMLYPALDLYE